MDPGPAGLSPSTECVVTSLAAQLRRLSSLAHHNVTGQIYAPKLARQQGAPQASEGKKLGSMVRRTVCFGQKDTTQSG